MTTLGVPLARALDDRQHAAQLLGGVDVTARSGLDAADVDDVRTLFERPAPIRSSAADVPNVRPRSKKESGVALTIAMTTRS